MRLIQTLDPIFFWAAVLLAAAVLARQFAQAQTRRAPRKIHPKGKKQRPSPAPAEAEIQNQRLYRAALIAVAAAGLFIRLWRFGAVPGGFNQDGAMAAVDGAALGTYGTDRFGTFLPAHLYAWGYGQMSALLSYLIAPLARLFGLSPVTARLPLLLVSVGGGVFFYLFVRDAFGKRAALIAAVAVAIDPWHFMQSRWALDCNLFPHFFVGGVCLLHRGLAGRRRGYAFLSMVLFGLCMYCYGISLYTVPLFLVIAAVYAGGKGYLPLGDILISAGIYLAVAWPFLLTMAVNFFRWDTIALPFVTIQRYPDSVRAGDILFFSPHPLRQLLVNARYLLEMTLLQKKCLPWNDIQGFGTMYLFSMPFAALGAWALVRAKAAPGRALTAAALAVSLAAGLLTDRVNVNRINIAYYFLLLLIVLGVCSVWRELKWARLAAPAMYAVAAVLLVHTYFTDYAQQIGYYFYDGFGQALQCAQDSGAARIYVTADAQGEGYAATSEILTLFYDQTDARYFQGRTDQNHGQTLLPYRERYHYVSMTPDTEAETQGEDAAYLVLTSDLSYFHLDRYDVSTFHSFCALVKKDPADSPP